MNCFFFLMKRARDDDTDVLVKDFEKLTKAITNFCKNFLIGHVHDADWKLITELQRSLIAHISTVSNECNTDLEKRPEDTMAIVQSFMEDMQRTTKKYAEKLIPLVNEFIKKHKKDKDMIKDAKELKRTFEAVCKRSEKKIKRPL